MMTSFCCIEGMIILIQCRTCKGAFTYDVSSRGRGFEILTVADKGGGGLSLADVSKNT